MACRWAPPLHPRHHARVGTVPQHGIEHTDRLGPQRWPPVGRHVDHHRHLRGVEQHVAREVAVHELVWVRGPCRRGGCTSSATSAASVLDPSCQSWRCVGSSGRRAEGGPLRAGPAVGAVAEPGRYVRQRGGQPSVQQPPGGDQQVQVAAGPGVRFEPARPPAAHHPPAIPGRDGHGDPDGARHGGVELDCQAGEDGIEPGRRRRVAPGRQDEITRDKTAPLATAQGRHAVRDGEQVEDLRRWLHGFNAVTRAGRPHLCGVRRLSDPAAIIGTPVRRGRWSRNDVTLGGVR